MEDLGQSHPRLKKYSDCFDPLEISELGEILLYWHGEWVNAHDKLYFGEAAAVLKDSLKVFMAEIADVCFVSNHLRSKILESISDE